PAAPLTFSTITDWPSDTRMRSFKTRASTSAGPAAGNGTIMVTGRAGKLCAAAPSDVARSATAPAAAWKNRRRRSVMAHLPSIVRTFTTEVLVTSHESGSLPTGYHAGASAEGRFEAASILQSWDQRTAFAAHASHQKCRFGAALSHCAALATTQFANTSG